MATERFEKLSQDKKQRILEAAREEFARVPYEEASINQIIKNAGISRGSFYTYFEDKNDLLKYIFCDEEEKNRQFFKELVLIHQGNFWDAIIEWTEKVAFYLKGGSIQQSINILTQSGIMRRIVDWGESQKDLKETIEQEQLQWLKEHLDFSTINVVDDDRLTALFKAVHTMAGLAILNLIINPQSDEEKILNEFKIQIDFLRHGADRCQRVG